MKNVEYISKSGHNALVVHPDLAVLSAAQAVLTQHGLTVIIARDLPTALLAISQHRFELCILGVGISEKADGWAFASVLHMCFPNAYIAMIAPEPDLLILQTAINTGVTQLYLSTRTPAEIAADIARDFTGKSTDERLQ
jgi:DNA-binding NtrC family response regulator